MKIAFVSTRGIPNNYGGLEEFAEHVAVGLVARGHEVIVYNPHSHPYESGDFRGVKIKKKFSPESRIGTAANFLYDLLSLRDSIRTEKCDAVLVCGYTTTSISYFVVPFRSSKVITNIDGLEWKRSKWRPSIQKLTKWFEKIAIKRSDALIADNIGISDYLKENFQKESYFIPYAADRLDEPDESVLNKFDLVPLEYFLMIGRLEPENNIEMILDGFVLSGSEQMMHVMASTATKYGRHLLEKYSGNERIKFHGWVSNQNILANLRHFSSIYFHGHSVGGTNPSLLEAMAGGTFIAAHANPFNKNVLGADALYFESSTDVRDLIDGFDELKNDRSLFEKNNLQKIDDLYNWENITDMYEKMFEEVVGTKQVIST